MIVQRSVDRHPAIAVKEACLARSGVYYYTYDEMVKRGYTPATYKQLFSEYRPPEVLKRVKDKFAFAAVTVEHTVDETTPENFRKQASGIVGDTINVKPMDSGDIGLFGNMALYTKDAWDYYKAGNKETSADYQSVCVPDSSGKYDFIMKDILSVNGVVLTARGRGGPSVRVMDSMSGIIGGANMAGKRGVLGFLGVGRSKDSSDVKLSGLVLDGAKKLHSLDAKGKEKLVEDIMTNVADLPDSNTKELLVGAIKDSLNDPTGAVANQEKVARVIDGLYDAALAAEDEEVKALLTKLADGKTQDTAGAEEGNAKKDGDGKDEDKDSKNAKKDDKAGATKDGAPDMDTLFEKFSKRVVDSLDSMIDKKLDAKMKGALGVQAGQTSDVTLSTTDAFEDEDLKAEGAFLLNSAFGN